MNKAELIALAAANAPNPSDDHMRLQRQLDRNRNPHNDPPPKHQLRDDAQIVADFKLQHALAIINAVERHCNHTF